MMILLLNYSHPLTDDQRDQLATLLGAAIQVQDLAVHVDRGRPLAEVARELVDAAGLDPAAWQTTPLLINPPALAPLALALSAELHGRIGGFPAILNIRPVANSLPTRYEIAEIVNLQAVRDQARARR
ncbi:MAG: CRISPR-associated protein Csx15 [Oscillochloridaceae bacterium umkhey_bin13]